MSSLQRIYMVHNKSFTVHIPNIITLINMATGFTAIIIAVGGNQRLASFLVLLAVLLDFLDGFAARMLRAGTPLGRELDSLADLVSFGVAPAVLMYYMITGTADTAAVEGAIQPVSRLEGIIPFFPVLLVLAGGFRLARFTIREGTTGFRGLPIPATGIFIAGLALIISSPSPRQAVNGIILTDAFCLVSILVLALLMVSRIPMLSLKTADYRIRGNEFRYLLVVLSAALMIFLREMAVPLIIIIYLLFSLISYLLPSKETR